MIFAIVGQWEKTVFWGGEARCFQLKQFFGDCAAIVRHCSEFSKTIFWSSLQKNGWWKKARLETKFYS
jgi:hypothetical protein